MKKSILLLFLMLTLSACGYTLHGYHDTDTSKNILGGPNATLSIGTIEQSTLYPWVPYYLTTVIRDEVILRRVGKWEMSGDSEYVINVEVPSFRVSAYDENLTNTSVISSATVKINLTIVNVKTGKKVWSSGVISYSENYENLQGDAAIQEILKETILIAFDRIHNNF